MFSLPLFCPAKYKANAISIVYRNDLLRGCKHKPIKHFILFTRSGTTKINAPRSYSVQFPYLFAYLCVQGQCTRHFKQVLHSYTSTISSLGTELLQSFPLRTFFSHTFAQMLQFLHFGNKGSCTTVSNGASVKTVPRHCAAPYSGVINKLFFPIHPNPPSSATVL